MVTEIAPALLGRRWVEIREECGRGRIVLRPHEAPVRLARRGRRQLVLTPEGGSSCFAPGAGGRPEIEGAGGWRLDDGLLRLDLKGWDGAWRIEELTDEVLVLARA